MKRLGFTLIELLLVIGIISVLSVAVFVALDPATRLKNAKDARRQTDVDTILTAIHQSIIDNKGQYPSNFPAAATEAQLGGATDTTGCAIATNGCGAAAAACVNLMTGTYNLSKYIASQPIDPGITSGTKTGYTIVRDANGIVTVRACNAESGTNIFSSR